MVCVAAIEKFRYPHVHQDAYGFLDPPYAVERIYGFLKRSFVSDSKEERFE